MICAVQAALKAIGSNPNKHRHHYQHTMNQAILPENYDERSSFGVRSLAIILRKAPARSGRLTPTELRGKFQPRMTLDCRW
jgi:hypothetical protein